MIKSKNDNSILILFSNINHDKTNHIYHINPPSPNLKQIAYHRLRYWSGYLSLRSLLDYSGKIYMLYVCD